MQKKAVMAYFEVLSRHLLGATEEHHEKSVTIVSFGAETGARDLQRMKYGLYLLKRDAQFFVCQ
jgi:hypothetical protein